MPDAITFTATILRKQADLPRYIIVKPSYLPAQGGKFSAMVSLNGGNPFLRNIHPWGKGSDAGFLNLTAPQCKAAGVDTGDDCEVTIVPEN